MITTPVFNRQPPNIRSHPGLDIFWIIVVIDYYPTLNRWQSRQIFNCNGKHQQIVLVCIHGCEGGSTFEWCRPDVDVVVNEGYKTVIDRFLKEDILKYLSPTFS